MLIGIHGKIGSGKSTLAKLICEMDDSFKEKSFAYKLKYIACFLTGTSLEDNFSQEGKNIYLEEWGMTLGEMQQKIGTDAMRNNLHESCWVLGLFADYSKTNNWVVSDVRFPNEAQSIKDRGGILVKLSGDPQKIRENSRRNLNHASEISLDNWEHWDLEYKNNKSLEDLSQFAKLVLTKSYERN